MELAITFHGTVYQIGAWIFYLVIAGLASDVAARNSMWVDTISARFWGAVWGASLVAALHLYPSWWSWLFAAVTVVSTLAVLAETDFA